MSMNDEMGIRGDAAGSDLLAAIKLAVVSGRTITTPEKAFALVEWIVELHEPDVQRSTPTHVFIEAIRATTPTPDGGSRPIQSSPADESGAVS